ncbi:hypothetical protein E8D34_12550 [Nocardioides sp. GY 10113]|uniref:hypothetical protein n=1 Tax=Nocardioides sp. GY 10113 TaxID=2569761 RepID=UPI0010A8048F|nr:hypothetical protein [Nocardioides sp. GY 10113]TIC85924.1 hypothetical protein E8D34_12550 [Nocardioides sp. GY 10113]
MAGKRAGARQRRSFRPAYAVLAVGITLSALAWGYLVYAAIDFGAAARQDGDGSAWVFLAMASIGAMACLFLAFMLIVRLVRLMGITQGPEPKPKRDPDLPKGGKRASR